MALVAARSAIVFFAFVRSVDALVAPYGSPEPLLLIAVNSALPNHARRDAARSTWMRHRLVREGQVAVRFALAGRAEAAAGVTKPEDADQGGLLSLPVEEGYSQLPQKTAALLHWFGRGAGARYLLKLDDDSYPHLTRLVKILRSETNQLAYLGDIRHHAAVQRHGKNAESPDDFPDATYPDYMHGGGYILSRPLVRELLSLGSADKLHNENTTVGVAVAALRERSGKRVTYRRLPASHESCHASDALTLDVDYRMFQCYWQNEEQNLTDVCNCQFT